ncbi:MAG: 2-oxoacid:ferredoxin oxidoreductase subunit beta, partial [Desulfonatronovibrio sp.]
GRKNKYKTTVDMYKYLNKAAVPIEKYSEMTPEKQRDAISTGIFVQKDCAGLEERYVQMRRKIRGEVK